MFIEISFERSRSFLYLVSFWNTFTFTKTGFICFILNLPLYLRNLLFTTKHLFILICHYILITIFISSIIYFFICTPVGVRHLFTSVVLFHIFKCLFLPWFRMYSIYCSRYEFAKKLILCIESRNTSTISQIKKTLPENFNQNSPGHSAQHPTSFAIWNLRDQFLQPFSYSDTRQEILLIVSLDNFSSSLNKLIFLNIKFVKCAPKHIQLFLSLSNI